MKKSTLSAFLVCLSAFVLMPAIAPSMEYRDTVKVGGTGCAVGTMKELAKAFQKKYPSARIITVPNLGTRGGITAVLEDAIDIGLSGRPLKESEIQQGATAVKYAVSPFIFVTAHTIEGMNFDMGWIARIYSGEIRNWPDGTPIRLIMRPEGDVDTIMLKNISPEMNRAVEKAQLREGMVIATSDQDSADAVEKIRGAIGISTLSLIVSEKRLLKALPLNGVSPSVQTITDKTYPYYKTLYLVTGPKVSSLAKLFIAFVTSREGKAILRNTGHLIVEGR